MATKGIVIQLNREQRVFLLKALKDGYIDLDALDSVGIRPASRFDNMTDEELEDEIVRLSIIERGMKPIYEDKAAQRVCKGCYESCSCWLAWMARDDREVQDKMKNWMEQKT
jgi:hypothetical protein